MADLQLRALRYELEAFTIDFWHEVDFNGAVGAAGFYLDDAVFATSVRAYRGRAELDAFYARRSGQAPRISVHTVANFRITLGGTTLRINDLAPEKPATGHKTSADPKPQPLVVRCNYILALYAADGVPVLPSRPAVMLATVDEVVQRHGDSWRYQSRLVHPQFRDHTPTRG